MRIGFNYREGMVLRDVCYDGRPLFYRVSLGEMCVSNADPRSPYHRKMAFDLGDVGAGMVCNDLKLGCDCVGSIAYLDGLVCGGDGNPTTRRTQSAHTSKIMKSAGSIAITEQKLSHNLLQVYPTQHLLAKVSSFYKPL